MTAAVARRAIDGKEEWGTRHDYPPVPTEAEARSIAHGMYLARDCKQLKAEGMPPLSVRTNVDRMEDGTFRPWLQVWLKTAGRREIVRRVKAGEPLAYNVMRDKVN